MNTSAYVTYIAERVQGSLTRENILDMINKAQNEILSNDNRITQITPDPFIHSGSEVFNGVTSNPINSFTFTVTQDISVDFPDTPTRGNLIVTEADGTLTKLPYQSYSGSVFNLEDDEFLAKNFDGTATCQVDQFDLVSSGALYSSIRNETRRTQFDVRRVSRVYSFTNNIPGNNLYNYNYGSYGASGNGASRRQDQKKNINTPEIDISCDTIDSLEPLSGDARIIIWEDNTPPSNPKNNAYYARAYRWPAQLTSEDVPLTIPARWQTTLLKFAIFKDEEYREYGKADNPQFLFDRYLKEFLSDALSGAQSSKRTYTTPRF